MTRDFQTLTREPVYLKVYRAIEETITRGELAAGDGLPTEAALCEQFGVTRSSVREGLRLLEQEGLVRRSGKRLLVTRPGSGDVAATASRGLELSGATVAEVWEGLVTFYPPAAMLAAGRVSPDTLIKLREIRTRLSERDDTDREGIVTDARAFFETLADGLSNRVMLALLGTLNRTVEQGLREVIASTPNARQRIARAQGEIIDAVAAGDGPAAAMWMARHIDDLRRGFDLAGIDLSAPLL